VKKTLRADRNDVTKSPRRPGRAGTALRRGALGLGAAALAATSGAPLLAEDAIPFANVNSFGMPGLIDMPTAESQPDATIGASIFSAPNSLRNSFSFQFSPRLTGAFRYSRIEGVDGGSELYDRSFDLHYRVLDEKGWRPAVAIGLRDFIGTGVYSSEYIVATKTLTPGIKVTGGLGWGRLASHNGTKGIGTRPPYDYSSTGGRANAQQWFRGDVAPFFGLSWAPNDRLTLKAEYSSDAYVAETATTTLQHDSPVNLGFDYRLSRGFALSGYYVLGSEVGVQLNMAFNPKNSSFPSGIEAAPLPVRGRPAPAADPDGWSGAWTSDAGTRAGVETRIARSLVKEGIILEAISLDAQSVRLRIRNERFDQVAEALGRTARILTRSLPPSVEHFEITLSRNGMPVTTARMTRSDVERQENSAAFEMAQRVELSDALPADEAGLEPADGLFPRLSWSARPYLEASLFDPADPVRADVGVELKARFELRPGLFLSGAIRQKVAGNLDETPPAAPTTVPHVRTDLARYMSGNDTTLRNLTLGWYAKPGPETYSRVTVGLLERMYGGVSGEFLWMPTDSRLALGAEVNWVRQRDFDQGFSFRDYEIVTGHASAYYDFGKGYRGQLDVGRYLAGDWGATVTLDREFANGWSVGAFATFTDMSSADFGEGSFDKGIRMTVPLSALLGKPSQTQITPVLRPLNRDGGARVAIDDRLFETVRDANAGSVYQSWGKFWR